MNAKAFSSMWLGTLAAVSFFLKRKAMPAALLAHSATHARAERKMDKRWAFKGTISPSSPTMATKAGRSRVPFLPGNSFLTHLNFTIGGVNSPSGLCFKVRVEMVLGDAVATHLTK